MKKNASRISAVLGAGVVALGITAVPAITAGAQDTSGFSASTVEDRRQGEEPMLNSGDDAPASRFIVTFNNMTTVDQNRRMEILDEIVKEHSSDASFVREMYDGSYVVNLNPPVPADRIPSLRGHLESKAEIAYADIDRIQFNTAAPNDQLFDRQWHLHKDDHGVDAPAAWDAGATGEGTVIAVVDSGITNHPDLNGKLVPGFDFISDPWISQDGNGRDNNPADNGDYNTTTRCRQSNSSWHGTHVAGIAAAQTDNSYGTAGVAPDAKIQAVRALGRCGGYTSDIVDSIVWASGGEVPGAPRNNTPADVINLSLGGSRRCQDTPYQDAIDIANRNGATVAVAAGNEDTWTDYVSPASCDGVITVGATGPHGHRASYSNFGGHVQVGAPGGDMMPVTGGYSQEDSILSTVNQGRFGPTSAGFGYMDGTSMATPVVSGIIALMKSVNPNLSNDEIARILADTATPYTAEPGSAWKTSQNLGAGIVNARAAVDAVRGVESPIEEEPVDPSEPAEPTEPTEPAQPTEPEAPIEENPAPGEEECKVPKSIFEKLTPGNWCD